MTGMPTMPLPRFAVTIVSVLTLGLADAALAHHSSATYDFDHMASMEATVKQVNWTNPHITFIVEPDVKKGGAPSTWVFEVSSPGVLTRSGWNKRSLQPGDHAVFHYAPLRDGTASGYLTDVTLPNGQKLHYSLTPADQPADK
jgi:Family of unknown function (DUF6152)